MKIDTHSSIRFNFSILTPQEIQNFVEDLHHLEREITYPIEGGEDRFYIDHGEIYHAFFSRMGKTRFLTTFYQGKPIGVLATVWKLKL